MIMDVDGSEHRLGELTWRMDEVGILARNLIMTNATYCPGCGQMANPAPVVAICLVSQGIRPFMLCWKCFHITTTGRKGKEDIGKRIDWFLKNGRADANEVRK